MGKFKRSKANRLSITRRLSQQNLKDKLKSSNSYLLCKNQDGTTTIFYKGQEVGTHNIAEYFIVGQYLWYRTFLDETKWFYYVKGKIQYSGVSFGYNGCFLYEMNDKYYRNKIYFYDNCGVLHYVEYHDYEICNRIGGSDIVIVEKEKGKYIIFESTNSKKAQMKQIFENNDELFLCEKTDAISSVLQTYVSIDSYRGIFEKLGKPTSKMFFCLGHHLPYYRGFWKRLFNIHIDWNFFFDGFF